MTLEAPRPLYTADTIARLVMRREMHTDTAALLCREYGIGLVQYASALARAAA